MSAIDPPITQLHHFFRSVPLPCPYLSTEVERKLFTRLAQPDATALNSLLTRAGFRRSHDIIYRPVCPHCQACVPVRIAASRFVLSRSMRRVYRVNGDLAAVERPAMATSEQFALFRRYQRSRHGESDMARMTESDYRDMIEEGGVDCRIVELRKPDGQLVGAILADRLTDGVSAVYSFFEPTMPERSLGTRLVLCLVDEVRRLCQPHVYLGYWIANSDKMRYKARFRPMEALVDGVWRELSAEG